MMGYWFEEKEKDLDANHETFLDPKSLLKCKTKAMSMPYYTDGSAMDG